MKPPFNEVLLNFNRLQIFTVLQSNSPSSFKDLKTICELSDGNLASHLRQLEKHELVRIIKQFNNRKPQTLVELTPKAYAEFSELQKWFYESFIKGE